MKDYNICKIVSVDIPNRKIFEDEQTMAKSHSLYEV